MKRDMTRIEMFAVMALLVVVGVAARVFPHIPNFAPVTATALFCGAYMQKRYSLAAPIVIMLLSDYLLLYFKPLGVLHLNQVYLPWDLWHNTLPYVYASFAISALLGWYLKGHRSLLPITAVAIAGSAQFFLLTNAGVWLAGSYARGPDGLWQSYVAGLPFLRGTLLGDLAFTAAFFGIYEAVLGLRGLGHLRFRRAGYPATTD